MKTRKRIVKEGTGNATYDSVYKKLDEIKQELRDVVDDVQSMTYSRGFVNKLDRCVDILSSAQREASALQPRRYDEFSGSDKSEWFDERGELLKPLPGQCIEDCSGSGRVDDEVAYWVNALKFDLGLPRERAINFLSEYGAWELDELDGMDDFNLAEKVLWIFCGNIKEEAYEQSKDETSLVYDWGDVSDWDDEDW